MRNWFYSTSKITSQQTHTLISLLSQLTDPQRRAEEISSHTSKLPTPESEYCLWILNFQHFIQISRWSWLEKHSHWARTSSQTDPGQFGLAVKPSSLWCWTQGHSRPAAQPPTVYSVNPGLQSHTCRERCCKVYLWHQEINSPAELCAENNVLQNVYKPSWLLTLVIKGGKHTHTHSLTYFSGAEVEQVNNFRVPGTQLHREPVIVITDISTLTEKAQKSLYFLRKRNKAKLPDSILRSNFRGAIEGILTGNTGNWFGSCAIQHWRALQWVFNTAQKLTGAHQAGLSDIGEARCLHRAKRMLDNTHSHPQPANHTSFFPQTVTLLNSSNSFDFCQVKNLLFRFVFNFLCNFSNYNFYFVYNSELCKGHKSSSWALSCSQYHALKNFYVVNINIVGKPTVQMAFTGIYFWSFPRVCWRVTYGSNPVCPQRLFSGKAVCGWAATVTVALLHLFPQLNMLVVLSVMFQWPSQKTVACYPLLLHCQVSVSVGG